MRYHCTILVFPGWINHPVPVIKHHKNVHSTTTIMPPSTECQFMGPINTGEKLKFAPNSLSRNLKKAFQKNASYCSEKLSRSCKSTYRLWNTGASNGLYFPIVKSKSCRKKIFFFSSMTQYYYIFPEHKAVWQTQEWNIKWLKLIEARKNNSGWSCGLYCYR